MIDSDLPLYCELKQIEQEATIHGERSAFISFLRNSAERLKKGDSVQAIWNDYLASNH